MCLSHDHTDAITWAVNMLSNVCLRLQIVAELTDLTQKLQLSYHALQQQQPKPLAASQLAPQAACLSISPTGKWAAVVVQTHVHVFDLDTHAHLGRLPALQVGVCFRICLVSCAYL